MALTTLLALRNSVADRADMDNVSGPVSQTQMNDRINAAIGYVYDEICKARGDEYFEVESTITTASGTQEYTLPADFLKVSAGGVWWQYTGQNIRVHKYNPNEGMQTVSAVGWSYQSPYLESGNVRYRLRVGKIRFVPIPLGSYTMLLKYIPRPPVLVNDSDTWDGYSGFEQAVIWKAAADCKAKEESDAGYELKMFDLEMQRLLTNVDRDNNEPPTVQTVGGRWQYDE